MDLRFNLIHSGRWSVHTKSVNSCNRAATSLLCMTRVRFGSTSVKHDLPATHHTPARPPTTRLLAHPSTLSRRATPASEGGVAWCAHLLRMGSGSQRGEVRSSFRHGRLPSIFWVLRDTPGDTAFAATPPPPLVFEYPLNKMRQAMESWGGRCCTCAFTFRVLSTAIACFSAISDARCWASTSWPHARVGAHSPDRHMHARPCHSTHDAHHYFNCRSRHTKFTL